MSFMNGDELKCSSVHDIEYDKRCEYIENNTECEEETFFYSYIHFLYCALRPSSGGEQIGYFILLLCLCIILLMILGTTVEKFFCPSLEMLSKNMGLSEHLAGVTILAFGNGSSDLITSLTYMDEVTTTMYSNLLGAAIFVTTFVSGVICLMHPFRLIGSGHLRDITFFIFAVVYIDYAVKSNNYITIFEAICILLIYVIYLMVISLDHYLLKRRVNFLAKLMTKGGMSVNKFKEHESLRNEANIKILGQSNRKHIQNIDATRRSFYGYDATPNKNLLPQVLESLNPINYYPINEWYDGGCRQKTLICLKTPIICVLMLFIPNVSYRSDRHGWCKLLNCIQLTILPFITFALIFKSNLWLGVPPCVYTIILTVPLATLAFIYSRTDKSPKFHVGFALLGAYGSAYVIYSCASQIVQILFVVILSSKSKNSFFGCTLLAWGNSIVDLITNTYLAYYGYHKMALAACYAGPLFNILLSLGIVLLIKTAKSQNGYVRVSRGPLGENCYVFLLLTLSCTLFCSLTTNFQVRRSVGAFSITLYVVFFLYTLLSGELDLLQTYADLSDL